MRVDGEGDREKEREREKERIEERGVRRKRGEGVSDTQKHSQRTGTKNECAHSVPCI